MKKVFTKTFLQKTFWCITYKKMSSLTKMKERCVELLGELLEEWKKIEKANKRIEKHEIIKRLDIKE